MTLFTRLRPGTPMMAITLKGNFLDLYLLSMRKGNFKNFKNIFNKAYLLQFNVNRSKLRRKQSQCRRHPTQPRI